MLGRWLELAGQGNGPLWSPGDPAPSRPPGSLQPHAKAFCWAQRPRHHRLGECSPAGCPACSAMREGDKVELSQPLSCCL